MSECELVPYQNVFRTQNTDLVYSHRSHKAVLRYAKVTQGESPKLFLKTRNNFLPSFANRREHCKYLVILCMLLIHSAS